MKNSNGTKKPERMSNFELLRLATMLLIIIHHLVGKSAATCGYTHSYNADSDGYMGLVINSLAVGGVNVFLLISGWFGCRNIWRQALRLVLDCVVYCLLANLMCIFLLGYRGTIPDILFSCDFRHNWFVQSYVAFLFLVPFIERALNNIAIKEFTFLILLLTLFNVGMGYFLGEVNTNGYNAINFAYLYCLGRWLHIVSTTHSFTHYASKGFFFWLLMAIPMVLWFLFLLQHKKWDESFAQKAFAYNNPLVVVSAICFFVPFTQIDIKSRVINVLARGVFAIFLMHTTSVVIIYRTEIIGHWYRDHGYLAIFAAAFFILIICAFIAIAVERMKTPIYNRIYKMLKI